LKQLHAEYGKDAEFLVVYIEEAHALDGVMPKGSGDDPIVEEPITIDERKAVAETCSGALDMSPMRMLIDGMQDTTSRAYAAFPDRLYLVGKDGKLVYTGGKGPRGFKPDELEERLHAMFESVEPKEKGRDEESPPSK
jgi:hypothetical protein